MKIIKTTLILTLLVIFMQGCKTLKNSKGKEENSITKLTIYQNGVETTIISPYETVEIDKKEFSLRFYNNRYNSESKEFYSAQIAAFINKSELDKVKIGISKSDLSCFEPGSGMAPYRSGKYESLIFNNSAHHYTIYENSESKRLNLLDDSEKLLKLEFEINSLYYDNTEVRMSDTKLDEFYIAFLIDRNLNGIIDKGELNKLTIKIK